LNKGIENKPQLFIRNNGFWKILFTSLKYLYLFSLEVDLVFLNCPFDELVYR